MLNPTPHPPDEILVAYLEACLDAPEQQVVAGHVRACDRCVELLASVQQRLSLADEIPRPVPAWVAARAAGLRVVDGVAPSSEPALTVVLPSLRERWGRRLAALFELPVLAPASFALGVLLMFAVSRIGDLPGQPDARMRAVPQHASPAALTRDAVVRASPRAHAPVVARLARGQSIEVVKLDREWAQVTLATGSTGWIERQALE